MTRRIPLEEWDRIMGPVLEEIRIDAGWLLHYAERIASRVKKLPARPVWVTSAEKAMEDAMIALNRVKLDMEKALTNLAQARTEYMKKELDAEKSND